MRGNIDKMDGGRGRRNVRGRCRRAHRFGPEPGTSAESESSQHPDQGSPLLRALRAHCTPPDRRSRHPSFGCPRGFRPRGWARTGMRFPESPVKMYRFPGRNVSRIQNSLDNRPRGHDTPHWILYSVSREARPPWAEPAQEMEWGVTEETAILSVENRYIARGSRVNVCAEIRSETMPAFSRRRS